MNTADPIIARVLAGETEAYGELVGLHQQAVWRVAVAILHDRAAAEDVVQQAFINAYLHLNEFVPGQDFAPWIKTIVRHVAHDHLRSQQRERGRRAGFRLWQQFQQPAQADPADLSTGMDAADDALVRSLEHCREQLAADAARVIDLRYVEACAIVDIAATLGRTVPATKQLLVRVRIILRDCMQRHLLAARDSMIPASVRTQGEQS